MAHTTFLGILFLSTALHAQAPLPLTEYPVVNRENDYFILVLSGDGGWHNGMQTFARYFQQKNIPVVGWNAKSYFADKVEKTMFQADLESVIHGYCQKWGKTKVILIGYSFGADVLPYAINHLSKDFQPNIRQLVLLQPGEYAIYEVTWASLLNMNSSGDPVIPEIKTLPPIPVLLVCTDEVGSVCTKLPPEKYPQIIVRGDHKFDGEFMTVAEKVHQQLE